MIRAFAVDLMDTVVRDPARDAVEAATGRSFDDVVAARDPQLWPSFERGEITEDEYFAGWGPVPLDVATFQRVRREGYTWIPGMRELLEDLGGLVVRVGATNYPVWVDELHARVLAPLVELVVASCHVGARKPDPAFYARLLEEIELTADEVLFVDDRPVNVTAALAVGMRGHVFTGATDLRVRLRDEGLPV